MYLYFNQTGERALHPLKCEENIIRLKYQRTPFFLNKHSILWHLCAFINGGSYKLFALEKGGKTVATAEVVTWIPKFKFMPKNGVHIGPCHTSPDERGQGLYPYLLNQIQDYYKDSNCYMIVSETNISSIKGVLKSGFKPYAKGPEVNGRFIISEIIE